MKGEGIVVEGEQDELVVNENRAGRTGDTGGGSCLYRALDPSAPDETALSRIE